MTAPTVRAVVELPAGALRLAAPEPLLVSQHTCQATLGLPRRSFLRLATAYCCAGGEVIRAGRLRLVEPTAFIEWLRSRDDHSNGTANLDGETAAVLDGVGLRLASGGAQ